MNAYEWKKTASGWGLEKRAGDPIYNMRYEGGGTSSGTRTERGKISLFSCWGTPVEEVQELVQKAIKSRGLKDVGDFVGMPLAEATWERSFNWTMRRETTSWGYDVNLEPRDGKTDPGFYREEGGEVYSVRLSTKIIYEGGEFPVSGGWRSRDKPEDKYFCKSLKAGEYGKGRWDLGEFKRKWIQGYKGDYAKRFATKPWWKRMFDGQGPIFDFDW